MNPALSSWLIAQHVGEVPPVEDLLRPPAWHLRAACRGVGVDSFISDLGGSGREARDICARCEVRGECLDFALARPDLAGIWGGTSVKERAMLRHWAARPTQQGASGPDVRLMLQTVHMRSVVSSRGDEGSL